MNAKKWKTANVVFGSITLLLLFVQFKKDDVLPEAWLNSWLSPKVEYRPLRIVHGADIRQKASYHKDSCGLGGVVCNVPFGANGFRSNRF